MRLVGFFFFFEKRLLKGFYPEPQTWDKRNCVHVQAASLLAASLISFSHILSSILEIRPVLGNVSAIHRFLNLLMMPIIVFHGVSKILDIFFVLSPHWYHPEMRFCTCFVSFLWTMASAVEWNQEEPTSFTDEQHIINIWTCVWMWLVNSKHRNMPHLEECARFPFFPHKGSTCFSGEFWWFCFTPQ